MSVISVVGGLVCVIFGCVVEAVVVVILPDVAGGTVVSSGFVDVLG